MLRLTKYIMLRIYNSFAIKLLFCQTHICELKYLKLSVVPYYPPGLRNIPEALHHVDSINPQLKGVLLAVC